jgi:formylglycine-generating enzyme required for sulfatase activity
MGEPVQTLTEYHEKLIQRKKVRCLNFILLLLACATMQVSAQTISAVKVAQEGQHLRICYTLQTSAPATIELWVSENGGSSWQGPLQQVQGDVGAGIPSGERCALWRVLEERESLVGSNLRFKVSARSRQSWEPEMVFVEGGTFTMGCTSEQGSDCESDESPSHQVKLSSFQIGKYEVTQGQWKAIMGNNPSYFSACDSCPVENVSWNDVQDFIRKLNKQLGKDYRLPTEAEWEYAARGGNKSKGYKYAGGNVLESVGWNTDNSGSKTHEVGQKQANELGLYDMTGNVWEWCSDWYGNYTSGAQSNPKGPNSGSYRVLRGGSWDCNAIYCRVSDRNFNSPDYRLTDYGFRLVLPEVQ